MQQLIEFNEEKRFSSLYICEQINKFRELEGNRKNLLHKSLITKIEVEFEDEITGQKILPSAYKDSSGKKNKMYELTCEQSLQLLMSESRYVRKGVIEVLKAQQGKIEDQQRKIEELSNYNIPKSFSEALMLAAEQAKEIEEKDSLLNIQRPKAEFYDTVTESDDTVDMAECAKILYESLEGFNLGRNNLFAYLRNKNILRHNNEPYQLYVDKGYFKAVEGTPYEINGETRVPTKTVVYQKGIDFIIKLWKMERIPAKI